jgi:hypothetical protein
MWRTISGVKHPKIMAGIGDPEAALIPSTATQEMIKIRILLRFAKSQ